jgi:hypothetical protein
LPNLCSTCGSDCGGAGSAWDSAGLRDREPPSCMRRAQGNATNLLVAPARDSAWKEGCCGCSVPLLRFLSFPGMKTFTFRVLWLLRLVDAQSFVLEVLFPGSSAWKPLGTVAAPQTSLAATVPLPRAVTLLRISCD